MDLSFSGIIFEWRGPAPHYFVALPEAEAAEIKQVAGLASYGWGVIPVLLGIDGVSWNTSLIPKNSTYLAPIRANIRKAAGLAEGDEVVLHIKVKV